MTYEQAVANALWRVHYEDTHGTRKKFDIYNCDIFLEPVNRHGELDHRCPMLRRVLSVGMYPFGSR